MIMKSATRSLVILLFSTVGGITAFSIRAVKKSTHREVATITREWSPHPDDRTRRRLQLDRDNECLLILKEIHFEDPTIEEDNWVCEFPHSRAMSEFNGRTFMDIDLSKDVINKMDPISGASILKTRGAFIEESLETRQMIMHIPMEAEMEVETLHETDPRHYKQRRMKRDHALRQLVDSSPGSLSVLVVRVVDAQGAQIDATNAQLVNDVFTDDFSLKTGYAQCSKDQMIIEPATGSGVSNGIVTVNIDVDADAGPDPLQQEALAELTAKYGSLSSQWDLVMVCQPPGSGNWLAYTYVNSYMSFYNDKWCQKVSVQMHEVGHNLGLAHSGQGTKTYGDQSCMMGGSYNNDDGPKMCFNAAKNFQLGWYDQQKESFDPLQNTDKTQSFILNGIDDYKKDGSSNGELVTLRIVEKGDTYNNKKKNYGKDYYVGYNRKTGPNSGTLQAGNQVVIFEKKEGGPDGYGESNRVAELNPGDSFEIKSFKGTKFNVKIRFNSLVNSGRDANIDIVTLEEGAPTMTPEASCGGDDQLQIKLNIDKYVLETAWELIDNESNKVIENAEKENHAVENRTYFYPMDERDYYCLDVGKCYTFKITDTYGDGLNYGEGSYMGYLDGKVVFEGNGDFTYEETRKFCVGTKQEIITPPVPAPTKSPTKKPTDFPSNPPTKMDTKPPTLSPTNNCNDQSDFLWKGKEGKNCKWVGKGNAKKVIKKCKKNNGDGLKIKNYCPATCAKKNTGPCK